MRNQSVGGHFHSSPGLLSHEVRSAWRSLWTQPRYVLLTALLFTIGTGASVAVFSVMRATLLGQLDYESPQQLVQVAVRAVRTTAAGPSLGFTELDAFGAQARTLTGLAAYRAETFTLSSAGEPTLIQGLRVSTGMLALLGVKVATGRDFRASDASSSAAPVALVSAGFCARQFGGDDCNVVGRSLTIDGTAFEVIGVLPSGHRFPGIQYRSPAPDVWIPLIARPDEQRAILKSLRAVGRMAPGATVEGVATDLDTIVARLAAEDPVFTGWHASVELLSDSIAGRLRTPLYVAFLAALLLLVTACVNAVSLMVARHLGTLPERAVRHALGATPLALLRYLLIENSLLMLLGLGGGIVMAQLTLMSFRAMSGETLGEGVELRLEWGTLCFALAIAATAVILTTLASWSATRRLPLAPYLKEASKAGGTRSTRGLTIVVAIEFGIACSLLAVGTTVFSQLQRLQSTSPGFKAQHAWAAVFNLPPRQYPTEAEHRGFIEALERELDATAGIDAVGAVARAPMIPGFATVTFTIEGNVLPLGQQPDAHYRPMSRTYLDAIGMKIREGRSFEDADVLQGGFVCVVSESLAARQWPGQSAIGKRLYLVTETDRLRTVVGVVADAHIYSLDERSENVIYVPLAQNTWPNFLSTNALVLRSRLDEPRLAGLLKDALRRVDPTLPVPQLRNFEEVALGSVGKRRFLSTLIFAFASIAALLAVFGVYGAFDYAAASGVRELAIRQALGATHQRLLFESLERSARILGAGLLIGLTLGWLLMKLAQSFLLGWSMIETGTVAAATFALLIVAAAAACLPTRAITRRSVAAVIREAA